METPVNRSCPGWHNKVREALAALGGVTSRASRGGMRSDRVALVGQSSADEARAVQSARGVLRSTRKGGARSQLERGEGAVNLGVDVGYARRRCDW